MSLPVWLPGSMFPPRGWPLGGGVVLGGVGSLGGLETDTPLEVDTPEADTSILISTGGHCSGRYTSYWNAFLFYHCLQKISYKSLKITGAVRAIKGQEVLQDDSTLEQHGIIDGSTVNIVIEPEKEINLQIKLGPKVFTHKVLTSVRVSELKQQLIDGGNVGFLINEFQLVSFSTWYKITLEDESLPLHLYGMGDNTTIKIVGWSIRIQLVNQKGEQHFKYFPRKMMVKHMKREIQAKHISLFLERFTNYRKLDDEQPIGDVLSHNAVIYYIEDKFFKPNEMIRVFHKCVKIEKIGHIENETVRSIKLRVQEHLGFPVSSLQVARVHPHEETIMGNNEIMDLPAKNYRVYES